MTRLNRFWYVLAALGLLLSSFLAACGTDDFYDPELVEYDGSTSPKSDAPDDDPIEGLDSDRAPVTFNKDGTVQVGRQLFSSVEEFHQSEEFIESGRRCGTIHNFTPSTYSLSGNPAHCSFNFTSIRPEYQPDTLIEIPVVFHVIQRTNGQGHIPTHLIHSQIEVLNEDFRALANSPGAGGVDTRIQFVLATEDPSGNPTNGINYHTNNQWFNDPGPGRYNQMMNSLNWDPNRYLNIYTNSAAGALGYASFPQQSAGQAQDGVVLLWNTVGRNAPGGGIYNQGRTATHEVGHYFGLFHTFEGGCGSANNPYSSGDRIADTAQHRHPDNNCQVRQSSCGTGITPIHNYMNYSPDSCMYEFTAEQVNRMRCSLINYRPDLYRVVGQAPSQPSPQPEPEPEPDITDGGALTSGQAVTGLSGSTDSVKHFYIDVPSNATQLAIEITGGTGDADLYVRRGAQPTSSTFDCRPYQAGNDEQCIFDNPASGRWHVMIHGYQAYQGLNLIAEIITSSSGGDNGAGSEPQIIELENLAAATGDSLNYYIDIPSGQSRVTFQTTGGSGDVDLYIRHGQAPTTSTFDYRPYLYGNEEEVVVDAPASGRWHIMLHAYEAFSGVKLRVILE